MNMVIDTKAPSPRDQFRSFLNYAFFMFVNLDILRSSKYVAFAFFFPLIIDISRLLRGVQFVVPFGSASLVTTASFVLIYCSTYFMIRLKFWSKNIVLSREYIHFDPQENVILIQNIEHVKLWGKRIIELKTSKNEGLGLSIGSVDLVFPDEISRNRFAENTQGILNLASRSRNF